MVIKRRSAAFILFLMLLFVLSAFGLLSFRKGTFDFTAAALGCLTALLLLLQYNIMRAFFKHLDRFVLLIAQFLWCVGLVVLYRIDPDYAMKQFLYIVVCMFVVVAVMLIIKKSENFGKWNWIFMGACVALLALPLAVGKVTGGAYNWIPIGNMFTFQPSEVAKILFILVSSYFLATRDKVLSFIPYAAFSAVCVLLLVASKDLGGGILFCGTFLIMFYAATGRTLLTLAGVGVVAGGAYVSYKIFPHVRIRVEVWEDPWTKYYDQGYQIVQGLMALASGGLLGVGLGLGSPESIPANYTDYIFTVICEEFGIIFGIFLIALYVLFIVRGILIALNARNTFDALLVFGCTAMLTLQSFIIIGGVIKLIPLTGITLPFISYGGSSMLASMIQLGIIEGVAIKNGKADEEEVKEMGGDII